MRPQDRASAVLVFSALCLSVPVNPSPVQSRAEKQHSSSIYAGATFSSLLLPPKPAQMCMVGRHRAGLGTFPAGQTVLHETIYSQSLTADGMPWGEAYLLERLCLFDNRFQSFS